MVVAIDVFDVVAKLGADEDLGAYSFQLGADDQDLGADDQRSKK